jgi:crotonobetainyl-CoA:carnitine CoA-transferase CaiB-like acyl-CoA transferase
MMTTMLSSAAHALSEDMITYAGKPTLAHSDPDFLGTGPLYRLYETADGWVFLAAPTEREWTTLVAALDGKAALGDDRFATAPKRAQHAAELAEVLADMYRTQTASVWERELISAGIGCAEVAPGPPERNYLGDLGRSNGYVSDVEHPVFGTHPRMAPMVRFSRSATTSKPGCLLGQHTESVLKELGFTDQRIASLRDAGVIMTP